MTTENTVVITGGRVAAALAKAQGEFKPLKKTKTVDVGKYKYHYADLADIREATYEALSKNELCLFQTEDVIAGVSYIVTNIIHSSGETITSKLTMIKQDHRGNWQSAGGGYTFARRYAISMALAIAADSDDDAVMNTAIQNEQNQQHRRPNNNNQRPPQNNNRQQARPPQQQQQRPNNQQAQRPPQAQQAKPPQAPPAQQAKPPVSKPSPEAPAVQGPDAPPGVGPAGQELMRKLFGVGQQNGYTDNDIKVLSQRFFPNVKSRKDLTSSQVQRLLLHIQSNAPDPVAPPAPQPGDAAEGDFAPDETFPFERGGK